MRGEQTIAQMRYLCLPQMRYPAAHLRVVLYARLVYGVKYPDLYTPHPGALYCDETGFLHRSPFSCYPVTAER